MMNTVAPILTVLAVSCTCFAQAPRDIAITAFKSVVLLEMSDSQGQPLSFGSGFIVSDGVIATNAHVIEGASTGTAKIIGDRHRLSILGTLAIDRHADLALLRVTSDAPALHLGKSTSLSVGDKVYVVGNPLGLEGTFSEGIISGIRAINSDSILQMTAPISPGSSGGPVMDASGLVIGVSVATFKDGQNLNLAIPVSYVSKLLASATPNALAIPLGHSEQARYEGRSIVDEVGTRTESGVKASNFKFTEMGGFQFQVANTLPSAISHVRVRIIYHDVSKSVMDFEDQSYDLIIPPGLTKTVTNSVLFGSEETKRAEGYYASHKEDGSHTDPTEWKWSPMNPKVELRVVRFNVEDTE